MRRARRWTSGALLGLAALGALGGCERPTGPRPVTNRPSAPPLNAEGWLNGAGPSWGQLAGKVVVLDVWAYW